MPHVIAAAKKLGQHFAVAADSHTDGHSVFPQKRGNEQTNEKKTKVIFFGPIFFETIFFETIFWGTERIFLPEHGVHDPAGADAEGGRAGGGGQGEVPARVRRRGGGKIRVRSWYTFRAAKSKCRLQNLSKCT
jgi:hypothetical protein